MAIKNDNKKTLTGVVCGCDKLRIRSEPNFDSDVITTIDVNRKIKVIYENEKWYKVENYRGNTGYVCSDYINLM